MKTLPPLIYILLCLASLSASCQTRLDTIGVNEASMVALLFSEPITHVLIGNDQYTTKTSSKTVYLKAVYPKSDPTNIMIEYGENEHFQGILQYQKVLQQYRYDKRLEESSPSSEKTAVKEETADSDSTDLYNLVSSLGKKTALESLCQKKEDAITAYLWNVANDDQQYTYLYLTLANASTLPFHFQEVAVRYRTKSKGRGVTEQYHRVNPVMLTFPPTVEPKSTGTIYLVLPHYGRRKNARLEISFKEKDGDRSVTLHIRHHYISNATLVPSPIHKNHGTD